MVYAHQYKDKLIKHVELKKTLQYSLNEMKKEEFSTLKRVMKDWLSDWKCRADVTIFREAKKCINLYGLELLKEHWEPSENLVWFTNNVFCGKRRPHKKFRILYEWVEDEITDNGSILGSEVREQAQILIGQDFGNYKKVEKLSRRIKKFLGLKAIGDSGKEKRWVSAA